MTSTNERQVATKVPPARVALQKPRNVSRILFLGVIAISNSFLFYSYVSVQLDRSMINHHDLFPPRSPLEIEYQINILEKQLKRQMEVLETWNRWKTGSNAKPWSYPAKNLTVVDIREKGVLDLVLRSKDPIKILPIYLELDDFPYETYYQTFQMSSNNCEKYLRNLTGNRSLESCSNSLEATWLPKSMNRAMLRSPFPDDMRNLKSQNAFKEISVGNLHGNNAIMTSYLFIVKDATIDDIGDVYTKHSKIAGSGCVRNLSPEPPNIKSSQAKVYNEVFTIAQQFGSAFYHFNIDHVPRMVPFLSYLIDHTNITIHINKYCSFCFAMLEDLGIPRSRLTTGILQARTVYFPQSTRCGTPPIFEVRLLSLLLRSRIKSTPEERRSIILIKRSERRWFKYHGSILRSLQELSLTWRGVLHFDVEVFPDDPVPPRNVSRAMFNRAFMVIAPHGAGLSNLVYSEPGTIVIEASCTRAKPCYPRLAYSLGHRYYGLTYQNVSCFGITPEHILQPVERYLRWIALK